MLNNSKGITQETLAKLQMEILPSYKTTWKTHQGRPSGAQ